MKHKNIYPILMLFVLGLMVQCNTDKKQNNVLFLSKTPIIDGEPDTELSHLPLNKFNYVWQFDNPVSDTANIVYRIGYTVDHLYLYIETNVDSVSYHRRGYLWGDGYKLLLVIPQNDTLTNEYYELAFSPTNNKEYESYKQRILYYNFDQKTNQLSKNTKSQEKAGKGKSGFEALIAWSDIEPYHPWFINKMGYNLYFAKGIESEKHGYFTNGFAVVEDEGIWDEEIPKRSYQDLSFEMPESSKEDLAVIKPQRRNLKIGEPLILKIASIGKNNAKNKLRTSILDSKRSPVFSKDIDIEIARHFQQTEVQLELKNLPSGKYYINIKGLQGRLFEYDFVVQPTINFDSIESKIIANEHQYKIGTINTLLFNLNQLKEKSTNLKSYETGLNILTDWEVFQKIYQSFNDGTDPYKEFLKPHRRAFKSIYDDTYQPYSIKLPNNFDSNKKYPLLVFLHGSGQDEQGLLSTPRSNGKFIELAPFARDKFRAYAEDYSQKDIIEAIEDVMQHFPVDKNNIIIGGFSMGGYGALRAYYENPKIYKGVAVFAGHPNLANEWLDGNHPNFLEDEFLTPFKGIPVFIYHGRKDAGLDVGLIEKMSDKLSAIGAQVTKSIVENNGHEYQDEETNELYFEWLDSVTNR